MTEKQILSIIKEVKLSTLQKVKTDIMTFFNTYKQDLSIGMILKYLDSTIDYMETDNSEVNNNERRNIT